MTRRPKILRTLGKRKYTKVVPKTIEFGPGVLEGPSGAKTKLEKATITMQLDELSGKTIEGLKGFFGERDPKKVYTTPPPNKELNIAALYALAQGKPTPEQAQPKIVSGLRPTSAIGTNPKDGYGLAKVPFSVIPTASLVFMTLAMKHGAQKYGPHNWRVSHVQSRVYLEAALRHLLALLDGEDMDPATGIHHGGFVMATIGIYLDAMVNGCLIDNRVLPGKTGSLIELFNQLPGQPDFTPDEYKTRLTKFLENNAHASKAEDGAQ